MQKGKLSLLAAPSRSSSLLLTTIKATQKLKLTIVGCGEQPHDISNFGESREAVYIIDIYDKSTARVNLTFYYDTNKKSNWIEISLPKRSLHVET